MLSLKAGTPNYGHLSPLWWSCFLINLSARPCKVCFHWPALIKELSRPWYHKIAHVILSRPLQESTWIWVRSWKCGCLVTWYCYQLIAKSGNKTAAVPWPDPYAFDMYHIGLWYPGLAISITCSLIASRGLHQVWYWLTQSQNHRVPVHLYAFCQCGDMHRHTYL